ncbi:MAG TPA: sugar phosphate isomerase/epimerase, partial [Geobacteraceae bacterium]|nr:sugar phosphate isomerase/epimerase [Geobacteraceae bacterium]
MNNQLFVHVPYPFLRDNLPLILERRINPEVFLPADVLDGLIPEELATIAEALAQNGQTTTIHGPF